MTAPKASTQDDKIVSQVLAALQNVCNHCHSAPVMGWEVAALHLAARRRYYRADLIYRGERNGDTLILVPSDSQPGTFYRVTVHPIAHPSCNCPAGMSNRPCKHCGAALALWAERMAAKAQASEQDEYAHLSREDRREMAAIAIRYHERREGRW